MQEVRYLNPYSDLPHVVEDQYNDYLPGKRWVSADGPEPKGPEFTSEYLIWSGAVLNLETFHRPPLDDRVLAVRRVS